MARQFTQFGGVRPFAVALVLAGVDKNGISLYQTDPSGTYIAYNAITIGNGSDQVNEFLEKYYDVEINMDDASSLAIESIYLIGEEKIETRQIKMAQIETKTMEMKWVKNNQIERYASKSKENAKNRTPK